MSEESHDGHASGLIKNSFDVTGILNLDSRDNSHRIRFSSPHRLRTKHCVQDSAGLTGQPAKPPLATERKARGLNRPLESNARMERQVVRLQTLSFARPCQLRQQSTGPSCLRPVTLCVSPFAVFVRVVPCKGWLHHFCTSVQGARPKIEPKRFAAAVVRRASHRQPQTDPMESSIPHRRDSGLFRRA